MTGFYHEQRLREQFRESAERDRQLTRLGWFWRNQHRPRKVGWQFRAGEALIRLGRRLQERSSVQPARTPRGL